MVLAFWLGLNFLTAPVFSAIPPRPSAGTVNLETEPILPSELLSNGNLSTHNVSSDNVIAVQCNAESFGVNLNVASCRQVFRLIVKDDEQITFAERGTLVPYQIPLPYRVQSSKS